jgi:prevent-host-death family protein
MRSVALSEVKDDLSRYLRIAAGEDVVITRHGKAAGVLIGFASEEDWFDYRLAHDPRFTRRIEAARASLGAGHGIRFEDLEALYQKRSNHGRTSPKRGGSGGLGRR